MTTISLKPYMIRAIHQWCTDNGFTPHISVQTNEKMMVPTEFIQDGQITFNTSYTATQDFLIDDDYIHFTARFGGIARDIYFPVGQVIAVFARENGQGMRFEIEPTPEAPPPDPQHDAETTTTKKNSKTSSLRIVK